MKLRPEELFFYCLDGTLKEGEMGYMPKGKALELLKKTSGEDFGDDLDKWHAWVEEKLQRKVRRLGID